MPKVTITITLNTAKDEIVLEVEDGTNPLRTITKTQAEDHANFFIRVHSNDNVEWRSTEASWEADFVTPLKAPPGTLAGGTASPFQNDLPFGSRIDPQISANHLPSPTTLAATDNPGEDAGEPRPDVFTVDPANDPNAEVDFDFVVSVIPNGTDPTGAAFPTLILDPRIRIFRPSRA